MTDFGAIVVSGADRQQFSRAFSAACRALPRDVAKRLCAIKDSYYANYGLDGAYERMNNRTVAQIFVEFRPEDEVKPIASGEVDGVCYRLYDAPSPRAKGDEPKPDK